MSATSRSRQIGFAALVTIWVAPCGCQPTPPSAAPQSLPPAYTSHQLTDPAVRKVAAEIENWAVQQVGADRQPLYSKVEVLPPVQTVQPYGVGAYQQEARLPVILTTGPGWRSGLKSDDKEKKAAEAFGECSVRLAALNRQPALKPTLTIQTPQGMELTWINYLDPSVKNVHGDE
jgi:hypothetical protein